MTHLYLINENGFAYATNEADLLGSYRHAFNFAGYFWAAYENGEPGWSEDANGLISYSDPLNSTEHPEPATWLLMTTGVITMGFFAKRHHRLSTMVPSK